MILKPLKSFAFYKFVIVETILKVYVMAFFSENNIMTIMQLFVYFGYAQSFWVFITLFSLIKNSIAIDYTRV